MSGLDVTLRSGRFGPYVQLGEAVEGDRSPSAAALPKGLAPDDVDLDKALGLLSLPREVGKHPEDGEPIMAGIGRFGPYVQHGKSYASLETGDDVLNIGLNRAVTLIAEKKLKGPRGKRFGSDPGRSLGDHPDKGGAIVVKNGRYGPYVSHDGVNATLPIRQDAGDHHAGGGGRADRRPRRARRRQETFGQAPQRAAAQGRRAQNTGENGRQAEAARCGSRQGQTRSQGQVGDVTNRRHEWLTVTTRNRLANQPVVPI